MRRGDVYYVRIPYSTGCEIQKNRPAVIVSNDFLSERGSLVTVVFLTTSDKRPDMQTHAQVVCKGQIATALVEQMGSVDRSRIEGYICRLSDAEMMEIDKAIGWTLGFDPDTARTVTVKWDGEAERAKVERDLLRSMVMEAMA